MDDFRERARDMLREYGLRVTGPRISVLSTILELGRPSAASDVIEVLGDIGLSEVTVYRNLNRLVEEGLLKPVDTPERRRRFEVRSSGGGHEHPHAHFVCDGCGNVTCLELESPPVKSEGVPEGFRVKASRLVLHGTCDTCC